MSVIPLWSSFLSYNTMYLCRSFSVCLKLFVTIQKYLKIAFPLRSLAWCTPTDSKIIIGSVFSLAVALSVPRFCQMYIGTNPYYESNMIFNISGFHKLPLLIMPTALHNLWYQEFKGAYNIFEILLPFLILSVFNVLTFLKTRKIQAGRKLLNPNQKVAPNSVGMFALVVILLCICHVGPLCYFYLINMTGVWYREIYMVANFCITLNSSVNFPLYYFKASGFKTETNHIFMKLSTGFGFTVFGK